MKIAEPIKISAEMRENLRDYLFSFKGQHAYIVADGAALDGLLGVLEMNKAEYCCLYNDSINDTMASVAPYLIKAEQNSPLLDWLLNHWGQFFGIVAIIPVSVSFEQVKEYFHSLLLVKHPAGRAVYFRFYDPRVVRLFFPITNNKQVPLLFGPYTYWIVESEKPTTFMHYWVKDGEIKSKESHFSPKPEKVH